MSIGNPYEFLRERYLMLRPSLEWDPSDPTWQDRARAALVDAVGVVDEPWPVAGLEVLSEEPLDRHVRQRVVFPSRDGWSGRGWLLIPEQAEMPSPAVVCLPGHGRGADTIVGLVDEPYQSEFALQCVREGWVALAVEQPSFGTNQSSRDGEKGSSCSMDSLFGLVLGETMTGWRARDAIAAYRALCTHPAVDPTRIATMGISGGGLTALWSAALEPGIFGACVSGYFCPMAHSILLFDHCPDNYVPGFARLMDIPDLAGLIAPRPLAVENGTEDPIFAAEGFRLACNYARDIYKSVGATSQFECELFQGDHVFHGTNMLRHLREKFGGGGR
ncbi:MAG TPA: alpha/beta hydrolase family protein [Fimbriimonas sp.]|nr:alpha/beta hydrolase family protein [Fimbriimonas sp.]